MKNLKFILLFALVLAMVYSCKKDLPDPPQSMNEDLVTHSQKVIALIKSFDSEIKSSLKTGGLLELDSAVWYTEALQNYEYAYPDSGSSDFVVFKSNYSLSLNAGGKVLLDDVEVLYNEMELQLTSDLALVSDPVKFLVVSDVTLDSTVGNTAHISVSNGLGFGNFVVYDAFEEDDDWIWGTEGVQLAGKCDGTEIGQSDGSNELARRLNNPNTVTNPPDGYTDIAMREATGTEYWDSNLNKGRLFWDDVPTNFCLVNGELTYHLWESDEIIYTYENNGGERPDGKDFIMVTIDDEQIPGGGETTRFHWYKIKYGKPYYKTIE